MKIITLLLLFIFITQVFTKRNIGSEPKCRRMF